MPCDDIVNRSSCCLIVRVKGKILYEMLGDRSQDSGMVRFNAFHEKKLTRTGTC